MTSEQMQAIHVRLHDNPAFREQYFSTPVAALQGYDLTANERLQLILPHFRWAITQRLAGVSRPHNPDAVKMLHELGIRAVVTLAEQPLPPGLLEQWDLHAEHIPIPDFTAPALEQVAQAVAAIDHFLDDGRAVAVHCGAGLGRTGTILACYLVAQGLSSDEALATVRAQQPGSVETPEQEAVIVRYAQYLAEQPRS